MSDNLVIVAIPEKDDRVWKISSEKVPHLTLCFLGEAENADVEGIMGFVQHAVSISEHGPFYLDVDHRDTLGDDNADVIFFNKRSYNLKWIKQFRAQLLQNGAIKTAYDSTEQYPEWLPHLTLGYPETPAKKLDDAFDDRLYSVNFDRIAVWTGNYEGPDFRLEWPEREDEMGALAYHDDIAQQGAEFLEHHGVKGMRWGHRKDDSGGSSVGTKAKSAGKSVARATGTVARALGDANFELLDRPTKRDPDDGTVTETKRNLVEAKIVDHAAQAFNRTDLPNIKAKPEYQEAKKLRHRLFHPKDPATKAYRKEVKDTYANRLEEVANSMTNASGTRQYTIRERGWELPSEGGDVPTHGFWEVSTREIKHAEADGFHLVRVDLDEYGFIDKIERVGNDMTHSDGDGDFLEHYGVKGMQWGVHKAQPTGDTVARAGTAWAGPFNLADKTFRDTVPSDTKTKVSVFGLLAYADPKVRSDLKDYTDRLATKQADKSWDKDIKKGKAWVAINNASADHFNSKIDALNAKHPDNVNKDWSKDAKYMGDVKKLTAESLGVAANKLQMANPSGTKKVVAEPDSSGLGFTIRVEEVKHAEGSAELHISVKYIQNAEGRITGFELDSGDIEHSATEIGEAFVEDFLAHYGVKGMKWGVSKTRFQSKLHERRVTAEEATRAKRPAQDVRAYPTIGTSKRKKAKVDTKGGVDHPPTEDAIKVAVAAQKIKKSGVKALSNTELRDVQQRLNLENDVARLMKGNRTAGQKFIDGLLGRGDKNDRKAFEYQLGDSARGAAPSVLEAVKQRRR